MTKVAFTLSDDNMSPLFRKGDVVIFDLKDDVKGELRISSIKGKVVTLSSTLTHLPIQITGTLIATHRPF